MTTMQAPPWIAMVQAHVDHAQADLGARATARDITNGAPDDVVGARPQTHRKETQA